MPKPDLPLRTTRAGLADQLDRLAMTATKAQFDARRFGAFIGQHPVLELAHDNLRLAAAKLVDLAMSVRVGDVPILAHGVEDDEAARYPLLERHGEGQSVDERQAVELVAGAAVVGVPGPVVAEQNDRHPPADLGPVEMPPPDDPPPAVAERLTFAVGPMGKAPVYYVRAVDREAAVAYVAAQHPHGYHPSVKRHMGRLPGDAWVRDAAELPAMVIEPDLDKVLAAEADADAGEADSWRSAPVSDLDLLTEAAEAFDGVEIRTIGELADFLAEDRDLAKLGMGPAAAKDTLSSLELWWATLGIREDPPWGEFPIDRGTADRATARHMDRHGYTPKSGPPPLPPPAPRKPRLFTFDVILRDDGPDGGAVIGQMKATTLEDAIRGAPEAFKGQEVDPARLEVRKAKGKRAARAAG